MDAEQQRLVRNGTVFRGHNDAIHDAIAAFQAQPDPEGMHGFMCECLLAACQETLELTTAQYREGRADSAWFLVAPQHLLGDEQCLVRDCGTYWIVMKHADAGGGGTDEASPAS